MKKRGTDRALNSGKDRGVGKNHGQAKTWEQRIALNP